MVYLYARQAVAWAFNSRHSDIQAAQEYAKEVNRLGFSVNAWRVTNEQNVIVAHISPGGHSLTLIEQGEKISPVFGNL